MTWDRRRFNRVPLNLQCTLELSQGAGPGTAYGVTIIDVCDGGVGIICAGSLPVGARVVLSVEGRLLDGIVVHCHAGNGHHQAGISVDHASGVLARLQWFASLSPAGHPHSIRPADLIAR